MKIMDDNSIKRIQISFLFFFIVYYLVKIMAVLFHWGNPAIVEDLFEITGEIAAIGIILHGILSHRIVLKKIWIFFVIGIMNNLVADFIWNINEIVFGREMPDVSFLDIFYLLGSFCFIIGIFSYLGKKEIYSIIKTGFDVSIIMAASMTLLYKYVLMPIWVNDSLPMAEKIILMLYPVMDIGYLTGMLSYIFNRRIISPKNRISFFLIFAFLLFFVSDILFTVNVADELSFLYDPFWIMGYACVAIASLYSNGNIINAKYNFIGTDKEKGKKISEYLMFLFPYIFACIFIMIFNLKYIEKDSLAIGATVTIILIIMRQIFALLENMHLLEMIEKTSLQLEEYAMNLDKKNRELDEIKRIKEKEANVDFLTQLYNRRYIDEWINKTRAQFDDDDLIESSRLLIDIDHYKEINDQFGHNTGDEVLKVIGQIIQNSVRSNDIAGRYGGDEFIVILPYTDLETSEMIGDRLRNKVKNLKFEEYPEMKLTLSIGNIYWKGSKKEYSEDQLIRAADKALYEAKKAGRNRIVSKWVEK